MDRATSSEFDRKRLVVAIAGSITSLALGTRATYGLFLDPVVETIRTGRAPFSLAIAVQAIVWGLAQHVPGAAAAAVMVAVGMMAAVSTAAEAESAHSFVLPSYVCGIVGHGSGNP